MADLKINGIIERNIQYPLGLKVFQAYILDNIPRLYNNGSNLEGTAFNDGNRIKYEAKLVQRIGMLTNLNLEEIKRERITITPQGKDYFIEVLIENDLQRVTKYSLKNEQMETNIVTGQTAIQGLIDGYLPEIQESD